MPRDAALLENLYQSAAPKWSDKMRALGYYDGYLGFLSHMPRQDRGNGDVIDIGAGTGAMAEAWVAIHGAPNSLVLLDPARNMLDHATRTLARRGVAAQTCVAALGEDTTGAFDVLLAAHVIEHFDDPAAALADMRRLARTGARLWLAVSKPHWCNAIIWLHWRHRTFRPDQVDRMLTATGFAAEAHYRFPAGPPSRTSFGVVARAV